MFARLKFLRFIGNLLLVVASFAMIYPVLFMALGAFTTDERYFQAGFLPIPNVFDWGRIVRTFQGMQQAYAVTLLRVGFYLTLTLVVGLVGGYLFSKVRFPGRDKVFLLMLSGLVMPAILMILPQFILMARFPLAGGNDIWGQGGHGFVDQWPILFLYGWVPPFAIFFFKQSFDMLPTEYEEAAKIDGAGMFTVIFQVYGPMLRPTLAVLTILTFLNIWNDYLWPSVAISGNGDWYPISFQMSQVVGQYPGPVMFMRFLMAMWPPAAVYFLLQRTFVQGLVASGLKG